MSRKSRRNQPKPQSPAVTPPQPPGAGGIGRRGLFIGTAVVLMIAFVVGTLLYRSEKVESSRGGADKKSESLVRMHSPTLGTAEAKVHIVEFLDPACEACAAFYPLVKNVMATSPDRIRLSIRHVPFHRGADHVVRVLEAARKQGKYWQALERVLATQDRWVLNHAVVPEQVLPVLAGLGLDPERLRADMNAPEIVRGIEQDLADAHALGVTRTPTFFVNGRPLPSFGLEELQGLVKDELRRSYP